MIYNLNKIYSDYANVHQVCREVLDVSNQSAIEAVLIGGSLLGMVRDGDFLPWDKDLDFAVFERDIAATLALEPVYRELGYECRVHHLGVRPQKELDAGLDLLLALTDVLKQHNTEHCIIGGALLNLYRDKCLFAETDTLGVLINPQGPEQLNKLLQILATMGEVSLSYSNKQIKSVLLVTGQWRVNFFLYIEHEKGFGWRDLNCEHWFDKPLFPAQSHTIDNRVYYGPAQTDSFLQARFGKNWHCTPPLKFTQGRVVGSMQLYKDGVMFDFIMHYVRGEKTFWFEPAANVISTKGFLPCSIKSTTAGEMLFPDHPEIFLQEHYGNWKVPVKTWDGAVDNPTIIPSEEAMQKILDVNYFE
ncbi:LicD family protein [Paraglaciecola aquimarina]|uniref:LicD family protein n=1 Tax=Paraglaciecola aquimarina TaxID=1235557 RepID=A0ABU3T0B8_9ALTE|nr:LicD family protein [Paraglaciecola aquimarina]MDU0355711.1 LicD family protein [Paraglaciecola aquimarina]